MNNTKEIMKNTVNEMMLFIIVEIVSLNNKFDLLTPIALNIPYSLFVSKKFAF